MSIRFPVVGPDVSTWANDMRRYLSRQWDRLSFRTAGQTASDDGVILWDAENGYPVVSLDGEWQEIVLAKSSSFYVAQAERIVKDTYGDTVSVKEKKKDLTKFGTNSSVGSTFETVAQFQGSVGNETFATTNVIDSIVSSSASDTQTIRVEGHTIDGSGNLTFAVQNVTLTGQTPVTLATPLARATRLATQPSGTFGTTPAAAAGIISAYDGTDGETSGVPDTDAAVRCVIEAGFTQSEKCATSISSGDYWFLTTFSAGIGSAGGSAARVTFRIETRDVMAGGAWLPTGRVLVVSVGQNGRSFDLEPFIIIPKNHDVRVVAATNNNTAEVFAELRGMLAKVIT